MPNIPPHIEAIAKQNGIPGTEFWDSHGTWVCKHRALEEAAARAGITWASPQVLESESSKAVAILAAGTLGDITEWSIGEASPKNNKNAYPWAMAEKRAKDRVILKLLGFSGHVYSDQEADDFKESAPEPKKLPDASVGALDQGCRSNRDVKAEYNRLKSGLEACLSVEMLDQWVNAWRDELDALPEDYANGLRGEYKRMRDGFKVLEDA